MTSVYGDKVAFVQAGKCHPKASSVTFSSVCKYIQSRQIGYSISKAKSYLELFSLTLQSETVMERYTDVLVWLMMCYFSIFFHWLFLNIWGNKISFHATWFQMVETLYNNGANSIWEHSLLDPASIMSGRRKANPQDKVQWVQCFKLLLFLRNKWPCWKECGYFDRPCAWGFCCVKGRVRQVGHCLLGYPAEWNDFSSCRPELGD